MHTSVCVCVLLLVRMRVSSDEVRRLVMCARSSRVIRNGSWRPLWWLGGWVDGWVIAVCDVRGLRFLCSRTPRTCGYRCDNTDILHHIQQHIPRIMCVCAGQSARFKFIKHIPDSQFGPRTCITRRSAAIVVDVDVAKSCAHVAISGRKHSRTHSHSHPHCQECGEHVTFGRLGSRLPVV